MSGHHSPTPPARRRDDEPGSPGGHGGAADGRTEPGGDAPETVRLPSAGTATPETGRTQAAGDGIEGGSRDGNGNGGGYSATALGSHWFERPGPEGATGPTAAHGATPAPRADAATDGRTLMEPVQGRTLPGPVDGPTLREAADAEPDRVEGEVLRFGPGVTAVVRQRGGPPTYTGVWHGTLAGQADAAQGPDGGGRRGRPAWRRYAPAAVILAAVLAFLAWQRFGPGVAVQDVSVRAPAEGPGCDGTADVVAVVATDGRAGTIAYRWERSDGTSSGQLYETVTRGQREATLHLRWTFTGRGEFPARAEVRIDSPGRHTAAAEFVYVCR